jgi:hypothetical protein
MSSDKDNIDDLNKNQFSNLILKTFDENIIKVKEKIEQNIPEKDNLDKLEKELKGDIENLSNIINSIIIKHHKDYISSFTNFMNIVRKDLQMKLEQMEKMEEERRKINNINIIKCERDYFRMESIRMHKLCKQLKEQLNDITIKMDLLKDEIILIKNKWKDSQNEKRHIVFDIEKNNLITKELENSINNLREILYQEQNKIEIGKIEKKEEKVQLFNLLDKYKKDLQKEKIKSNKAIVELVKIKQERNKLENIFIDCVEETRKNIFNRRLRQKSFEKIKNNLNSFSNDNNRTYNININYSNFLAADKKKIIENFILNDDVSNYIRDVMFIKNNKVNNLNIQNMSENKININQVKLPSIIENNNSKIKKSESTKELINYPYLKKIKIIK